MGVHDSGKWSGCGEVLAPCFALLSASYLEVLEACVFPSESEVRVSNKGHDSNNQTYAKEDPCSGSGMERNLEARKEGELCGGHLPAPSTCSISLSYTLVHKLLLQ